MRPTLSLAKHVLRRTLVPPVRYLGRMFGDRRFREYELLAGRLRRHPRYSDVHVRLGGYDLHAPDAASLLSSWNEIFLEEIYACPSLPARPRILDLGANIGLSVLYHRRYRPDADIVAYEADPRIFSYLSRNLETNGIRGVTLVNKAVWDREELLPFWSEGADGGRVDGDRGAPNRQLVPAVDAAAEFAGQTFDFVKMDIEGAEARVLPRCAELLGKARAVFVEYHSRTGEPQALADIHKLLADAGLRVFVAPVHCSPRPFSKVEAANGFDLQLNLYAIR